jgi:predicted aspartyl protease
MLGYFDAKDGNPKVVLEVEGTNEGVKNQINALFDTGHSGSLSLTTLQLIEIGAKLSSIGVATYADGNSKPCLYFKVKVTIDGIQKEVDASLIENPDADEAIAGLELFSPYISFIDFKNKSIMFVKEEDLTKRLKEKKEANDKIQPFQTG